MSEDIRRTYTPWQEFEKPSLQREYTEPTRLLDENGTLLASGFAKHNVFDYDRANSKPAMRTKEWDFYQVSNGRLMAQVSFANISVAGYVSAVLVDLRGGRVIKSVMSPFVLGRNKYPLPKRGDAPHTLAYKIGGAEFEFVTREGSRKLHFKYKDVECDFSMSMFPDHENITTVLPFSGMPTRYFMTTKENSMPCEGIFRAGGEEYSFSKEDTFAVLDWGRVNTPRKLVWYWGNGSHYVYDKDGGRHVFGFEITWGIGDESAATETCMFYDGRAYKFGAVDVETFPKPDKYMQPWRFISEDGRFDMTMTPFYDHLSDMNLGIVRMLSHQVHGMWKGHVELSEGLSLDIDDMYAFCEYVENKW